MPRRAQADPQVQLGRRIRELRLKRGLSQEALANASSLDRTYISSVERGHRNASLLTLHRIAAALEVEPAELLERAARNRRGQR
jgi:transcriptional regulator with XRE-family HTH domain